MIEKKTYFWIGFDKKGIFLCVPTVKLLKWAKSRNIDLEWSNSIQFSNGVCLVRDDNPIIHAQRMGWYEIASGLARKGF